MTADPLAGADDLEPTPGPRYGWVRRVFSIALVSGIVFILLAGAGFGAKTSCTNEASVNALDEASCDVIDAWAWGGLLLALAVTIVGYAALVPKLVRESYLLSSIVLVVVVTTVGMTTVRPA